MNFEKFLRTPSLQNTSDRLLLKNIPTTTYLKENLQYFKKFASNCLKVKVIPPKMSLYSLSLSLSKKKKPNKQKTKKNRAECNSCNKKDETQLKSKMFLQNPPTKTYTTLGPSIKYVRSWGRGHSKHLQLCTRQWDVTHHMYVRIFPFMFLAACLSYVVFNYL